MGWSLNDIFGSGSSNSNAAKVKRDVFIQSGGPQRERARFESTVGYGGLTGEDKQFADQWLDSQDWASWNAGWDDEYSGKFKEALLTRQNQGTINRAKERYEDITNPNSKYNQSMYKRISRIYAPNSYENTMLYQAMGLSSKSSAYLGQKAYQQQERQASDRTETAFMGAVEQGEARAQGYLGLGLQGEQSLLNIISDTRLKEAQLKQQKEIEDNQRRAQLMSNLATTGVAIGTMFIPGGQPVGMSLLAKSASNWS